MQAGGDRCSPRVVVRRSTTLRTRRGDGRRSVGQRRPLEILGISERHAWRLLAAYRARGTTAPGARQPRAPSAQRRRGRRRLGRGAPSPARRYPGANHTRTPRRTLLWEHEGLDVSSCHRLCSRILARAEHRESPPAPAARAPSLRRERMPREGMLLQVDGSHHAWLEQRGPRFALLLAVDDATGAAVHALFRPVEELRSATSSCWRRSSGAAAFRSPCTATATASSKPPPTDGGA